MEKYLERIEAWGWRYRENAGNYPGLHFTARPAACDALITCLHQLRREGGGAHRTAPLLHLRPEDEARVSGGQQYETFHRIRLSFHQPGGRLKQMSFRAISDSILIDFTERALPQLEQGIMDVKSGIGDYAIAPREDCGLDGELGELDALSERLWFWPCFGHTHVVK